MKLLNHNATALISKKDVSGLQRHKLKGDGNMHMYSKIVIKYKIKIWN